MSSDRPKEPVLPAAVPPGEYPFTGRFLELPGGLRYHYLDEGAGEPLIMLHGNPTWSFYYRHLVRELRNVYRVIVPDHIGCGLSDKPPDSLYRYTLEQRVADLERLLEHLGLQHNLTLIMHDWGGMIGMAYAVRHRSAIARLVAMNTAAFHLPAGKRLPLTLKICRDTQLGAFLIQGLNAFARGAALIGCRRTIMPKALRRAYCAPYDNWQHRVATLRFVQDIPLRQGDPAYALVSEVQNALPELSDVPLCVCWGLRDFVFDGAFLARWETLFPEAHFHRFADAGHYLLEDARDEIIPLIRTFLSDHPLSAAAS